MNSFDEYFGAVNLAAAKINRDSLEQAFKAIDGCARLYIMGNGGSAASADHWVCDYMKGINEDVIRGDILNVKAISLASNGPLVTALANDMGYEHIFAKQLQYYRCQYGDVVLAMSASGNSKNVINGLLNASRLGATTVALTGFTGGEAAKIADINVHVPSFNYGVVEDCHMMILHAISQRIRYRDAADRKSLKL
jgi:D-sedoheptulose 7-phosphate isomerase